MAPITAQEIFAQIVTAQFHASLLDHMHSPKFVPEIELDLSAFTRIILFPRPIKARFLKLLAISPFDATKPYATVAELQPIVTGESN